MNIANFLIERGVAFGASRYDTRLPDADEERVVARVLLPNGVTIPALVDTGAPYSVLTPELAEQCRQWMEFVIEVRPRTLRERGQSDPHISAGLLIRGQTYQGRIYKMPLELTSDYGESLIIEANVFVPNATQWSESGFKGMWIGMWGFLDSMRWGIDPEEQIIYFGQLGDTLLL